MAIRIAVATEDEIKTMTPTLARVASTFSVKPDSNYVIREDEQIVGCGAIVIRAYTARIMSLYVYPEYRRKGYFKALMRFFMGLANEHKVKRIVANCSRYSLRHFVSLGAVVQKVYANGYTLVHIDL
jgi:N-acetylglutamate synthase-like GNAT family acetyltransferase